MRLMSRAPGARRAISITRPTVTRPKTKADRVISRVDAPSKMAKAAPKAAPLEAPRMSGEAMGLWKTPWKAAPAADREQPTRHAMRMRGRRMLMTTVSISRVQVLCRAPRPTNSSRNRAKSIFTTCQGGTPYRPREKETKNSIRSTRPRMSKARRARFSFPMVGLLPVIFT